MFAPILCDRAWRKGSNRKKEQKFVRATDKEFDEAPYYEEDAMPKVQKREGLRGTSVRGKIVRG